MALNICIIVVLLAGAAYCDHRWRTRPTYIHGWWHYQSSGPGFRWQPGAWYDACQLSLERSRERRERRG